MLRTTIVKLHFCPTVTIWVLDNLITLSLGVNTLVVLFVVLFGVSLEPTTTMFVKLPVFIVLNLTMKLADSPMSKILL